MFEFLKEWITGVIAMVIFITIIDLLIPSGSGFKRYVSLVTGMIVVITILVPVFKLLDRNNDVQATISRYTSEFDKRQFEIDKNGIREDVNKRTMEVFREKLKASLESEIYKSTGKKYSVTGLEIVEDSESVDFASIKSIELRKSGDDGSVKPVDNVSIGSGKVEEKEYRDEKVVTFLKDNFNVNPSVIKFKK